MSGVLPTLLGIGAAKTFQLTIGNSGTIYGFSAGLYGSMAPAATFYDNIGSLRTIQAFYYDTSTSRLYFNLDGGADSGDTFRYLTVNGTRLERSTRSAYTGSPSYLWEFNPGSNIIGTSGTIIVTIE